MADLHETQGHLSEALKLFEKSRATYAAVLGEGHSEVIDDNQIAMIKAKIAK
jgi:hypothetical protein